MRRRRPRRRARGDRGGGRQCEGRDRDGAPGRGEGGSGAGTRGGGRLRAPGRGRPAASRVTEVLAVGVMSGTSLDGVSTALVRLTEAPLDARLVAFHQDAYAAPERAQIIETIARGGGRTLCRGGARTAGPGQGPAPRRGVRGVARPDRLARAGSRQLAARGPGCDRP